MDEPILVALCVAVTGVYLALFWRQPHIALHSVQRSWTMFAKAFPWIVVSMLVAGLIESSLDRSALYRLFGPKAGLRGVLLATLAGSFGTGSRWGAYPLAAAMLSARAGLPSVMAFTTSWMLISIPRSASEFPFFGIRLTFFRIGVSYVAAFTAGLVTLATMRLFR